MEYADSFILWAQRKMNDSREEDKEVSTISKVSLKDEAMECEHYMGQLLVKTPGWKWAACWDMWDIW